VEVTVQEAQPSLAELLARPRLDEEIVIASDGKPMARLVPVRQESRARKLGSAKGDFAVPDDFNAPLPAEVLAAFAAGQTVSETRTRAGKASPPAGVKDLECG
jgi:prevent-host-death family protein